MEVKVNATLFSVYDEGVDITSPTVESCMCLFVIAMALLLASAAGIGGGEMLVNSSKTASHIFKY